MNKHRVPLIVLAAFLAVLLIYGLIAGFGSALRCGVFTVAALLPLFVGIPWIYQRFWYRTWLVGLLISLLIGLVAFGVTLIFILINQPPGSLDWAQVLLNAGKVGVIGLGAALPMTPICLKLYGFFKS
jgi:hypothetical protein